MHRATTTSCRRSSAWRSATPGTRRAGSAAHVNTTCKLLLMTHAFETLGAQAGRLAHRQLQLRQPARDRAPRRPARRRAAPPRAAPRRHGARHRDVQHDRRRVAGGRRRSCAGSWTSRAERRRPRHDGPMAERSQLITSRTCGRSSASAASRCRPTARRRSARSTRYSMEENKGAHAACGCSPPSAASRAASPPAARRTASRPGRRTATRSPSSPSASRKARRTTPPQLYVIAPDGGEARRVSDFAPGIEAFKWFPDGKRIAFVAWVWPELQGRQGAGQAPQGVARSARKAATSPREAQYRYWDRNLPMGRVAAPARARRRDRPRARPVRRQRPTSCSAMRPGRQRLRHLARRPAHRLRLRSRAAEAPRQLQGAGRDRPRSGRSSTTLALDPAWDFEAPRYSPGRPAASPSSPATSAAATRCPPTPRCCERGGTLAGAERRLGPRGRRAAALVGRRRRALLHRRGPRPRPPLALRARKPQRGDRRRGRLGARVRRRRRHRRHRRRRDGPPGARPRPPRQAARRADRALQRRAARRAAPRRGTRSASFAGANGEPVQMWVDLPAGLRPEGKKYPVLHSIHGGPHAAAGDTFHYRWNNHVFAAQGYVVACVNYHGSSGFGHAFLDSITHRWGELELQDVEAAHRLAAQAAAGSTRSASSPPAAATAATWSRG